MIFVDTNYFLRFLFDDRTQQHEIASNFFLEASRNKKNLTTSTLVIFEIYWVLGSVYQLSKSEKINIIHKILDMSFIYLVERNIFQSALEMFKKSTLEFEDCYNIAFYKSNKIDAFATFDKKIKKSLL